MKIRKFTPIERILSVKTVISALSSKREKDFYFSGEMHNFWEIVFVVSGNVMCTADEKVFSLSAGQLVFHKPMEFHRIWSENNSNPHLCNISFEAEGEGMRFFENKIFSLGPDMSKKIEGLVKQLGEVISASNFLDYDKRQFSYISNKAAVEFESFLFELYGQEQQDRVIKDRTEEQYEYIVSVLNAHCNEALTVNEIANLCNFSPSNLKRIFHMYSDIGIMRYFNSIKIRRAMQMLLEGEAITKISDELGFSSPSYFHSVFKKETGLTPKEYIRKNNTIPQK